MGVRGLPREVGCRHTHALEEIPCQRSPKGGWVSSHTHPRRDPLRLRRPGRSERNQSVRTPPDPTCGFTRTRGAVVGRGKQRWRGDGSWGKESGEGGVRRGDRRMNIPASGGARGPVVAKTCGSRARVGATTTRGGAGTDDTRSAPMTSLRRVADATSVGPPPHPRLTPSGQGVQMSPPPMGRGWYKDGPSRWRVGPGLESVGKDPRFLSRPGPRGRVRRPSSGDPRTRRGPRSPFILGFSFVHRSSTHPHACRVSVRARTPRDWDTGNRTK